MVFLVLFVYLLVFLPLVIFAVVFPRKYIIRYFFPMVVLASIAFAFSIGYTFNGPSFNFVDFLRFVGYFLAYFILNAILNFGVIKEIRATVSSKKELPVIMLSFLYLIIHIFVAQTSFGGQSIQIPVLFLAIPMLVYLVYILKRKGEIKEIPQKITAKDSIPTMTTLVIYSILCVYSLMAK